MRLEPFRSRELLEARLLLGFVALMLGHPFDGERHLFALLQGEVLVHHGLLVWLVKSLLYAVGFAVLLNGLKEIEAVVALRKDDADERLLALVRNQLEGKGSGRVVGPLDEGLTVVAVGVDRLGEERAILVDQLDFTLLAELRHHFAVACPHLLS